MRFIIIFNTFFLSAIIGLQAQSASEAAETHSCGELLTVLAKAANPNSEAGQAIHEITTHLKKLDEEATKTAFNDMRTAYAKVRPHFYSYDPLTRRTVLRFLIKGLDSNLTELSNFSMDELMQIHSEALDRLRSQKSSSNVSTYEDSPELRVVKLLAQANFPAAKKAWKLIQTNENLPLRLGFSTDYSGSAAAQ